VMLWCVWRRKTWRSRAAGFVKNFILLFPVFMTFMVLVFSVTLQDRCELVSKQPGVRAVFSFCDASNEAVAEKYASNVYHCRNAFLSADRKLVYTGFGAETNNKVQALLGVDPATGKIERHLSTYTVFRGYCDKENSVCVHLVSPKDTIRIWDDEKQVAIDQYVTPKDRPRFLAPDQENGDLYVASDADWIARVDLKEKKVVEKIKVPTGSLLTIDDTREKIVGTINMGFRNVLMVVDKKSREVENIRVGSLNMWKSLGFFFHVAADPVRERVFVAAPFECAVYMVDLKTKKTVWRVKLPIGIRDLTYDTKRDVLYASNFVNGYVYKIKAEGDSPQRAGRIFLGKRLRYFNYEPDMDIFLGASANGFFMYDPEVEDAVAENSVN